MSQVYADSPKPSDGPSDESSDASSDGTSRVPRASRSVSSPTSVWKQRFASIIGSAVLIAAVIGVLAGIAWAKVRQIQTAMSEPPPPELPVSVRLETVSRGLFRPNTTVVGTVLAPQTITLR
ncbi:MAG: hypothetical protein AAGI63_17625, partial [Planctomycetota bacterium]